MRLAHNSLDKRLKAVESDLERYKQSKGDRVTLVYTDGRSVKCFENQAVRIDEIGAAVDWSRYVDGIIDKPPEIKCIINHDTGDIWDLEESARKPPMTAEEAEEIIREITKNISERY